MRKRRTSPLDPTRGGGRDVRWNDASTGIRTLLGPFLLRLLHSLKRISHSADGLIAKEEL
jgi:hypothetical protein